MSIESAKAFYERIKTDEEFARQVSNKKNKEERLRFVSEMGYNFTKEELDALSTELPEFQLDEVSGGYPRCPNCPSYEAPKFG